MCCTRFPECTWGGTSDRTEKEMLPIGSGITCCPLWSDRRDHSSNRSSFPVRTTRHYRFCAAPRFFCSTHRTCPDDKTNLMAHRRDSGCAICTHALSPDIFPRAHTAVRVIDNNSQCTLAAGRSCVLASGPLRTRQIGSSSGTTCPTSGPCPLLHSCDNSHFPLLGKALTFMCS